MVTAGFFARLRRKKSSRRKGKIPVSECVSTQGDEERDLAAWLGEDQSSFPSGKGKSPTLVSENEVTTENVTVMNPIQETSFNSANDSGRGASLPPSSVTDEGEADSSARDRPVLPDVQPSLHFEDVKSIDAVQSFANEDVYSDEIENVDTAQAFASEDVYSDETDVYDNGNPPDIVDEVDF